MELNSSESAVFFDCQNKVSFVASFFSQENSKVELDHRAQAGLALILLEVLDVLDALEDGKYCDSQTASAVSEERTLADSEAAHQNEQAEAQGVQ